MPAARGGRLLSVIKAHAPRRYIRSVGLTEIVIQRRRGWSERLVRDIPNRDVFYPERGGSRERVALSPPSALLRPSCLAFALDDLDAIDNGIWGGTSPKERREIQRSRRKRGHTVRGLADCLRQGPDLPLEGSERMGTLQGDVRVELLTGNAVKGEDELWAGTHSWRGGSRRETRAIWTHSTAFSTPPS
jgi:hypothetical protein